MSNFKGFIEQKELLFCTTDSLEEVIGSQNWFSDAFNYCDRLDMIKLIVWHGVDIHCPLDPSEQPQVSATVATLRVMGKRAKLGVGKQVSVELIGQYEVPSRDEWWSRVDATNPPAAVPASTATRVRSRSANAG